LIRFHTLDCVEELEMADKPKEKRETKETGKKPDPKGAETVNLSADELKRISGGVNQVPPKPG
jgi:hypothetical protein